MWLWGEGSTAVASDSTHFRAWDQNIFTQWHSRYRDGKRSVLPGQGRGPLREQGAEDRQGRRIGHL